MPVSRPPQIPPPPRNGALHRMAEAVNRMVEQLEEQRQDSPNLAVDIARMSRTLEERGLIELPALPSTIRRAFENLAYVTLTMTRGQGTEQQTQLLRAMFMTARIVAEAYELEEPAGTAPPSACDHVWAPAFRCIACNEFVPDPPPAATPADEAADPEPQT